MVKKAKSVKVKRPTITDRIVHAENLAYEHGREHGNREQQANFGPHCRHQKNVTDFVRMIESWGLMSDDAVIMIAGTDLKNYSHGAVPYRLMKVIGEELKRLGYKP